jgi:hypothetical protein
MQRCQLRQCGWRYRNVDLRQGFSTTPTGGYAISSGTTVGRTKYLERHLAANDYYCENESVIGSWTGKGARRLGLEGEIHAGDRSFENLRNNRCPDGEKLTPRDSPDRTLAVNAPGESRDT